MRKAFKYAGVAGVLCVFFSLYEIILSILGPIFQIGIDSPFINVSILFLALITYVIFMYGFRLIGDRYKNSLLKITSYILIILQIVLLGSFLFMIYSTGSMNMFVLVLIVILMGATTISFGIALLRFKSQVNSLAVSIGIIEIITGACLISVVLGVFSILLSIVFYILGSIMFFREAKKI